MFRNLQDYNRDVITSNLLSTNFPSKHSDTVTEDKCYLNNATSLVRSLL